MQRKAKIHFEDTKDQHGYQDFSKLIHHEWEKSREVVLDFSATNTQN